MLSRRQLLASLALKQPVPMRAITKGPKFHWFGYYDKLEFDPTGRYVLGNEVDFEGRSPRADDTIRVGMVDLKDNDRWIDFGETRAWNWQQGCMLQWVPGSKSEVLWNDRVDGEYVSHILDVKSGKKRTIPHAVYTLAASGKWGIACDFRRLNDVRPGYGYAGIADPNRDKLIPDDIGIWKVDLATGKRSLLISVADAARIPYPAGYSENAKHWFNHLLIAPGDQRFIFLHRWRGKKEGSSFATRMFTADADGKNLHVLDPYGKTSHFVWRDKDSVIAWAWHPSKGDRFYLYRDRTDQVEVVGEGVMTVNGHCTYLPKRGNRWVLNDTYPDKERKQNVYVFDTRTGERKPLGSLVSPPGYTGEWRCDTHPRSSPDGRSVVVDSAHAGGRQMYLFDISGL
ncbi:MAG: hypothetical protein B7X34_09690 [Acidobacteriia bacterium 12-62-4]|nr:MAG: hypothetical protein B7X34_09690 [Acidobacteriia bacterium 12-62-4]